jgi:hypothetical protein
LAVATIDAQSGRAAAIARRQALSAGKAALPPSPERVRDGQRSASAPQAASAAPPVAAITQPAVPLSRLASSGLSGRAASLERRRLLSAGKAAVGATPQPAAPQLPLPTGSISGRDVSRARRIALSQTGRTELLQTAASAPSSAGKLVYAPKVVESTTGSGQRVTGSRIGRGQSVTGDERGSVQPVSGTQYVEVGVGGSWRASGPKVGLAKTAGGLTVSGTLVRSAVAITGDEATGATVTGRADQSPADDLTARSNPGSFVPSQFSRPANARAAAFAGGSGLARVSAGSRERQRERVAEATGSGIPITGSALSRSTMVTGDQGGVTRNVTGNRFMAPARRLAEAGQPGAPAPTPEPELASVPKAAALSMGGQRVSGLDIEHNKRVTGDEPGSCAALTGSQYQGPATTDTYCGADTATRRRMRARSTKAVTGNTALHVETVTGTGKGAVRDITGTRYFCPDETPAAVSSNPVAELDSRFSIRTPQRSAHLAPPRERGEERITGSFAAGTGKLTGNVEFQTRRRAAEASRVGASAQITGEGSSQGTAITGNAWSNKGRVTGVDGTFASARNPTERGEPAKPFAGATTFKSKAKPEEANQLVTGSFSKTGARVTLSGGAQT